MNETVLQNTSSQGPHNKSTGPIVGIIVIVVVLIFGGLYFWGQQIIKEGASPTSEEILNAPDVKLNSLETQDTSDEINAIEKDLNATNLENLDEELMTIEQELGN